MIWKCKLDRINMGNDLQTCASRYPNLFSNVQFHISLLEVLPGSHNEERSQNQYGKWYENGFLTYQTWKLLEGIFKCRTQKCPRLKPSYGKKGSQERSHYKANRVWRLYLYYYWYTCFLPERWCHVFTWRLQNVLTLSMILCNTCAFYQFFYHNSRPNNLLVKISNFLYGKPSLSESRLLQSSYRAYREQLYRTTLTAEQKPSEPE